MSPVYSKMVQKTKHIHMWLHRETAKTNEYQDC